LHFCINNLKINKFKLIFLLSFKYLFLCFTVCGRGRATKLNGRSDQVEAAAKEREEGNRPKSCCKYRKFVKIIKI
jgi:hypothetical protein